MVCNTSAATASLLCVCLNAPQGTCHIALSALDFVQHTYVCMPAIPLITKAVQITVQIRTYVQCMCACSSGWYVAYIACLYPSIPHCVRTF